MPSPCCPPDSVGAGTPSKVLPKGQLKEMNVSSDDHDANLAPMPCYWTTGSADTTVTTRGVQRVVLVFSDVYGFDSANHWTFADGLAERLNTSSAAENRMNTIVLVPDLFRGNPIMQPVLSQWLPSWLADALDTPWTLYRLKFQNSPERIEKDLIKLILPWIRRQIIVDTTNEESFKLTCVWILLWWLGHGTSLDAVQGQ